MIFDTTNLRGILRGLSHLWCTDVAKLRETSLAVVVQDFARVASVPVQPNEMKEFSALFVVVPFSRPYVSFPDLSGFLLVSFAAVFRLVTQRCSPQTAAFFRTTCLWGGALRDEPKKRLRRRLDFVRLVREREGLLRRQCKTDFPIVEFN